jgi:ribosomal protein L29
MNPKELRAKSVDELEKMKTTLEAEVVEAYFEMRTGKVKNVRKPRMLRKSLALLLTIINEKKEKETNPDKISAQKHE